MITRDQWNKLTPQQQFDYVQILEDTVDSYALESVTSENYHQEPVLQSYLTLLDAGFDLVHATQPQDREYPAIFSNLPTPTAELPDHVAAAIRKGIQEQIDLENVVAAEIALTKPMSDSEKADYLRGIMGAMGATAERFELFPRLPLKRKD